MAVSQDIYPVSEEKKQQDITIPNYASEDVADTGSAPPFVPVDEEAAKAEKAAKEKLILETEAENAKYEISPHKAPEVLEGLMRNLRDMGEAAKTMENSARVVLSAYGGIPSSDELTELAQNQLDIIKPGIDAVKWSLIYADEKGVKQAVATNAAAFIRSVADTKGNGLSGLGVIVDYIVEYLGENNTDASVFNIMYTFLSSPDRLGDGIFSTEEEQANSVVALADVLNKYNDYARTVYGIEGDAISAEMKPSENGVKMWKVKRNSEYGSSSSSFASKLIDLAGKVKGVFSNEEIQQAAAYAKIDALDQGGEVYANFSKASVVIDDESGAFTVEEKNAAKAAMQRIYANSHQNWTTYIQGALHNIMGLITFGPATVMSTLSESMGTVLLGASGSSGFDNAVKDVGANIVKNFKHPTDAQFPAFFDHAIDFMASHSVPVRHTIASTQQMTDNAISSLSRNGKKGGDLKAQYNVSDGIASRADKYNILSPLEQQQFRNDLLLEMVDVASTLYEDEYKEDGITAQWAKESVSSFYSLRKFNSEHPYANTILGFISTIPFIQYDPVLGLLSRTRIMGLSTNAKRITSNSKIEREIELGLAPETLRSDTSTLEAAELQNAVREQQTGIQHMLWTPEHTAAKEVLTGLTDDVAAASKIESNVETLKKAADKFGLTQQRLVDLLQGRAYLMPEDAAAIGRAHIVSDIKEQLGPMITVETAETASAAIDDLVSIMHRGGYRNATNVGKAIREDVASYLSLNRPFFDTALTADMVVDAAAKAGKAAEGPVSALYGAAIYDARNAAGIDLAGFAAAKELSLFGFRLGDKGIPAKIGFGIGATGIMKSYNQYLTRQLQRVGKKYVVTDVSEQANFWTDVDKAYLGIFDIVPSSVKNVLSATKARRAGIVTGYAGFTHTAEGHMSQIALQRDLEGWMNVRNEDAGLGALARSAFLTRQSKKFGIPIEKVHAMYETMVMSPDSLTMFGGGAPRTTHWSRYYEKRIKEAKIAEEKAAAAGEEVATEELTFESVFKEYYTKEGNRELSRIAEEVYGLKLKKRDFDGIKKAEVDAAVKKHGTITKKQARAEAEIKWNNIRERELPNYDESLYEAQNGLDHLSDYLIEKAGSGELANDFAQAVLPSVVRDADRLRTIMETEHNMYGQMDIHSWKSYFPVYIEPAIAKSLVSDGFKLGQIADLDNITGTYILNKNAFKSLKLRVMSSDEINAALLNKELMLRTGLLDSADIEMLTNNYKVGIVNTDPSRAIFMRELAYNKSLTIYNSLKNVANEFGITSEGFEALPLSTRNNYVRISDLSRDMFGSKVRIRGDVYIPKSAVTVIKNNIEGMGLGKLEEMHKVLSLLGQVNSIGRAWALTSFAYITANFASNSAWSIAYGVGMKDVAFGGYMQVYNTLKNYAKKSAETLTGEAPKEINALVEKIGKKKVPGMNITVEELGTIARQHKTIGNANIYDDLIQSPAKAAEREHMRLVLDDLAKKDWGLKDTGLTMLEYVKNTLTGRGGLVSVVHNTNAYVEGSFRTGALYRALADGKSVREAVEFSRTINLDYSRQARPPIVTIARETIDPFANYTYHQFKQSWTALLSNPTIVARQMQLLGAMGNEPVDVQMLIPGWIPQYGTKIKANNKPGTISTEQYPGAAIPKGGDPSEIPQGTVISGQRMHGITQFTRGIRGILALSEDNITDYDYGIGDLGLPAAFGLVYDITKAHLTQRGFDVGGTDDNLYRMEWVDNQPWYIPFLGKIELSPEANAVARRIRPWKEFTTYKRAKAEPTYGFTPNDALWRAFGPLTIARTVPLDKIGRQVEAEAKLRQQKNVIGARGATRKISFFKQDEKGEWTEITGGTNLNFDSVFRKQISGSE